MSELPTTLTPLEYSGVRGHQHDSWGLEEVTGALAALQECADEPAGFFRLPWANQAATLSVASRLAALADTLIVVGIGGSSLGLRALYDALRHTAPERAREIIFIETFEPDRLSWLLGGLDVRKCALHVVTKSGNTLETLTNLVLLERWMMGSGAGDFAEELAARVVVTTDSEDGPLAAHALSKGYTLLPMPAHVGGRFSVLSSVAMLGLSWLDVDTAQLLAGARSAAERALSSDVADNPALAIALDQAALYKGGVTQTVFMPYASQLESLTRWFVQLWAESLGKSTSVGPTPVAAVGTQDQHSLLQLIVDGPKIRNVLFVEAEASQEDWRLPELPPALAGYDYIQGKTLQQLRAAALEGVRASLNGSGIAHATLGVGRFGAFGLGELIFTLEAATVLCAALLRVDPFGQPGVEASKQQTLLVLKG